MAYQNKEDQDAFLTSLEGKLRGPYSSLELSKIIQTKSLRGSLTSEEYLQNIAQVLSRTDKTTYLRTIVGLLGVEPTKRTDEEIYTILTDAQVSTNEDWVRVVAGLVRGILFVEQTDDDDGGGNDSRESCRGEEASTLLNKTCREIVEQTRELEKATEGINNNNATSNTTTASTATAQQQGGKQSLQSTDMYPLYVSYRYSLLDPELLDQVIPEHKDNPYFQCNATASILMVDDKIEKEKAEEAQDQSVLNTKPIVSTTNNNATAASSKTEPTAVMPGMTKKGTASNTTSAAKNAISSKSPPRKKTSMFMPTKRPGMTAGRVGGRIPTKGTLHTRKAGAAQTLLGKSRVNRSLAAPSARSAAQMGRAQKLANAKSRMKMIDDSEMRQLNTQHKKRDDKIARREKMDQKLLARKRRIMEAAAEKGLVVGAKVRRLEEEAKEEATKVEEDDDDDDDNEHHMDMMNSSNNTGGGGFMAFVDDEEDDDDDDDDHNAAAAADGFGGGGEEEWQEILKGRSNKLSDDDRVRVQQFFTNRHNPTPDQGSIYKMKLHEERTTDPATGQAMKETYYLELDYSTGETKQSKKTKRY